MKIKADYFDGIPEHFLKCSNLQWELKFDFPKDPDLIFNIINSKHWPTAVEDNDLLKTDWDHKLQAKGIYYNLLKDKGSRILILGHMPILKEFLTSKGIQSDCYSIERIINGEVTDNYDTVLLYDVIDHVSHIKRCDIFKALKNILSVKGLIVCRCHPWTSIHGGHCFEKLNKAYAHLFLDSRISLYQSHAVDRITNPITYYDDLFTSCGFDIKKVTKYKGKIPDVINSNDILDFLAIRLKIDRIIVEKTLEIQFIDYVLS